MINKPLNNYPLLLGVVPVLALLCVAVLNYTIDPYRIFSSNKNALYSNYAALHPNLRLHKAYQINQQKPDTIILGTSKAIQGVPLEHAYFSGKAVYNLAAPLASMREIYHLLLHAQSNQPLKEVVFVVDFLSFNVLARADGPAAGYVEDRLKTETSSSAYWPDYLAATVSADALKASIAVLRPEASSSHRVLNGLGGRQDQEIASRLSDGGHRSNSQKIERFFIDSVLLAAPHRRFAMSSEHDDSLLWFERFVDAAQQMDIKTTLIVGPSHTRYWELLHQGGLWPLFEQWKSALVSINHKVAVEHNKPELPLWDFTLPNAITSEVFPASKDSETKMQYYYEAVHFNQHTGGLMLDRISGQEVDGLPENFGVVLNESSLLQLNARLANGLAQFRDQSPGSVEELLMSIPESVLRTTTTTVPLAAENDID